MKTALLAALLLASACGGEHAAATPPPAPATPPAPVAAPTPPPAAAEAATMYTCSMHPEVMEAQPGKCPKCGMDLVPMAAEGAADHDHGKSGEMGTMTPPAPAEGAAP